MAKLFFTAINGRGRSSKVDNGNEGKEFYGLSQYQEVVNFTV
jgi:hypothetical protein